MPLPENRALLMFYNVENLFPPDQKPKHRLDPTNSGLRNWDQDRYDNKIKKIAYVLELVKEEHELMPVLIGLSEIQGDQALTDLISEPVFEANYGYIHYESLDERGVDVALLYDKTQCEILHSEPISFIFEFKDPGFSSFDTTRDVLYCKIKINGKVINYYLLHLPSKREKDINRPKREYILNNIKERILEAREDNSDPVIVCGDFNEDPDNSLINNFILNGHETILKNPFEALYYNKQFSTYHNATGLLFDQFLLSNDLFAESATIKFEEAFVFNNLKLGSWDRKFQGRPFRTYAGTRYLGGYSDHYPVLLKLRINETK